MSTDHKPLLGILRDNRTLDGIKNPRILGLKERTLMYNFSIQYNPGKWHRGPDALSRNPVTASTIHAMFATSDKENSPVAPMEEHIGAILRHTDDSDKLITREEIEDAATNDPDYQQLIQVINSGFPQIRSGVPEELRTYWNLRNKLSTQGSIVMMDSRIVVPKEYRSNLKEPPLGSSRRDKYARESSYSGLLAWNREIPPQRSIRLRPMQ